MGGKRKASTAAGSPAGSASAAGASAASSPPSGGVRRRLFDKTASGDVVSHEVDQLNKDHYFELDTCLARIKANEHFDDIAHDMGLGIDKDADVYNQGFKSAFDPEEFAIAVSQDKCYECSGNLLHCSVYALSVLRVARFVAIAIAISAGAIQIAAG